MIRGLNPIMYDRIAFASASAKDCYTAARVLPARCTTRVFDELPEACACHHGRLKGKQMTFVGALEHRKGLPDLLAAWRQSGLGAEGWQLVIAGSGPLADDLARAAAADPSIVALGPINRREVHEVMARTAVVVLPSRRWGRWREQIGYSIAEGLAHGCHVVATPDSGLAGWLRRHGHDVLPENFTVADLRDAMRRVASARLSPAIVEESLPPLGGRMAAEDWMCSDEANDGACFLMRIHIVGTRGFPSSYGGFETLVRHLAPYLVGRGHQVTVFDREPHRHQDGRRTRIVDEVRVFSSWGHNGTTSSTLSHGLSSTLVTAKEKPNVALVMNVANGFFLPVLRARGVPVALNVDGIEWEREKWSSVGSGSFGRPPHPRHGGLTASSQTRGPSPNGGGRNFIGTAASSRTGGPASHLPGPERVVHLGLEPGGYVLIVARLVPENNVAMMLEAAKRTGKPTVVVGSGGSDLEQQIRAEHNPPQVTALGHVSDQDLLSALWAHCGVYLHGHSVGGTNPALVQAMGWGRRSSPWTRRSIARWLPATTCWCRWRPMSLLGGRICCFDRSSCGPPPQSGAGRGSPRCTTGPRCALATSRY